MSEETWRIAEIEKPPKAPDSWDAWREKADFVWLWFDSKTRSVMSRVIATAIIADHQQAQQVAVLERENKRLENQAQQSWDERVLYLNHLRNLLARIHRDGGHYVEEHGLEKAVEDAHEVWADLESRSPHRNIREGDDVDG